MRLLHTSDWHLGARLADKDRKDTQEKFLHWLSKTIREEHVDTLVVAGDVFDNSTPNHAALTLYYQFLASLLGSGCKNIIITGGNHDSATLLEAPAELLAALNIRVVGAVSNDLAREIIPIRAKDGSLEAVLCAVPFLREKDILQLSADAAFSSKDQLIAEGVMDHYRKIGTLARTMQNGADVPLIVLGHLFVSGAVTSDSERSAYVGTLGQIGLDAFPQGFDYLALGHIHRPQIVGGNPYCRYSGSPYAIDFSEAEQIKEVILVDFRGKEKKLTVLPVPFFERLRHLVGDAQTIRSELLKLIEEGEETLCAVDYTASKPTPGLLSEIRTLTEGSSVRVLRFRDRSRLADPRIFQDENVELMQLEPIAVFSSILESGIADVAERDRLLEHYREILHEIDQGAQE